MGDSFILDKHFISVSELLNLGLSYYKINKLVDSGKLVKLNRSMYENTLYKGEESDFAFVNAYAPRGIVCMTTAARYYGLTTFLPDSIDVAIERNMKVSTLPDRPSVNIWYFPQKRYEAGIVYFSDLAGTYKIYDIEKTVIDILYYRNKIGIEETKEILKNYLQKEDRNIVKMHRLAESLDCGKILSTYLEVLL